MSDENTERDLTGILAWSAPAPMHISLLTNLLEQAGEELKPVLEAGITGGWLEKSKKEDAYALTEQARRDTREKFPVAERPEWTDMVCQRFGDWFEFRRKQSDAQSLLESQSPHLSEWLSHIRVSHPRHACRLTWYSAYPFYYKGELEQSMALVQEALKLMEALPGGDTAMKAEMLDDEGAIHMAGQEPEKALQNYLNALNTRIALYGETHQEIAGTYDNIADAYAKLGEIEKGLEFQEKSLKLRISLFGEEHRETALSYNNIGAAYHEANRFREALSYLEKSSEIREKTLGFEHAETIDSLTNLIICMIKLRKMREAYEKVSSFLKHLPSSHPKHMEISSMLITIDRECVKSGFRPVSAQKTGAKKKKKKK